MQRPAANLTVAAFVGAAGGALLALILLLIDGYAPFVGRDDIVELLASKMTEGSLAAVILVSLNARFRRKRTSR